MKGILYAATQEGKYAWEFSGLGGFFTHTFLDELDKDKIASLDKILFNVALRAVSTERQ